MGRERELAALDGPESVVIVEGMPGIGKTSLLARYAHGRGGTRPVFWLSFRGVESLAWLANRAAVFLAQHGSPALLEAVERGAEVADRPALLLAGLDDARLTVVLDDLHRCADDGVRGFVEDAVARVRRGKLLLASREAPRYDPSLKHVRVLRLAGLGDEECRRFLERKGVALDAALLPKLREEVGGHPLALNLLLETARERGGRLADLLDRIPERNVEEWLLREVDATLAPEERQVLAHASVFRGPFTLEDLSALHGKDPEGPLVKLRRRVLVQAVDGAFALHEVLRNFFYGLVAAKRDLHLKAADHFLGKGTLEGHLEAIHHSLAAGQQDRVLELLERNLDLKEFDVVDAGYQNLYLEILESFARDEVRDARHWALIEDEKGDIRFHRAEYEAALAHYEEAAALFEEALDAERLADLAWKRAMVLERLGRRADALKACEKGLRGAPKGSLARERLEEQRQRLVARR